MIITVVPKVSNSSPLGIAVALDISGPSLPAVMAGDELMFDGSGFNPNVVISFYYEGLQPAEQIAIGLTRPDGSLDAMLKAPSAGTLNDIYLGIYYYTMIDGVPVLTESPFSAVAVEFVPEVAPTPVPQPPIGISALIADIINGSFVPTYITAGYASAQTATQLASLLGGTVVQLAPFACTNWMNETKANFIQLNNGMVVNAADLAYYAAFKGAGTVQLAASLTQEINQGAAITAFTQQMIAYLSGTSGTPPSIPTFQPNVIGPAIPGMVYPPGCIAADGSVVNPLAQAMSSMRAGAKKT